jgi:hypothetical protein
VKIFLVFVSPDPARSRLSFMEFYEAGFLLYWARSFAEGLTFLGRGSIDLVIVDAEYGETETFDFCRDVTTRFPHVKLGVLLPEYRRPPPDLALDLVLVPDRFESDPAGELKKHFSR